MSSPTSTTNVSLDSHGSGPDSYASHHLERRETRFRRVISRRLSSHGGGDVTPGLRPQPLSRQEHAPISLLRLTIGSHASDSAKGVQRFRVRTRSLGQ